MKSLKALRIGGVAAALVGGVWFVLHQAARWDDSEIEYHRWAPSRSAGSLVLVKLEGMKADHGRYPERLPADALGDAGFWTWYYQSDSSGSDYELWCRVGREDAGFDALVFSPDGLISPDWPGARTTPGAVWTLVEHADRAPPDRWQRPINP